MYKTKSKNDGSGGSGGMIRIFFVVVSSCGLSSLNRKFIPFYHIIIIANSMQCIGQLYSINAQNNINNEKKKYYNNFFSFFSPFSLTPDMAAKMKR